MKQSYTKFGFAIQEDCTRSLQNLAADIKAQNFSLLILIDEYDTSLTQFFHRPEELQKFKYNSDDSIKVMSVFRNFFATLKLIVQYPKIYLFIAGVSPQSLNDFTSGFNIGYYLGEQDEYAGILGYPEEFVMKGIMWLNIPEPFQEAVLNKLKEDNNGYQYAYAPEIKSVYNPAKINYCFLMMQNKLKKDYIKNEKDLKRFMKFLFDFAKNKDSRPAGSTLDSLTLIKDVDKILFKILNNPKLCLMEKISRPSLSFWDFHKETQVISYLYYCGALTYAPYSEEEDTCITSYVKIPNKCAEKEYFARLKDKIQQTITNKIETALKMLFNNNEISYLLNVLEDFFLENTKNPDIAQSREDGLDWSIYILLKTHLGNQIERQMALNNKKLNKTFYDDLMIFPSSHPKKMFLIEEKNIAFTNLTTGLINYFKNTNNNYPELSSKSWETLFKVYNQIFFKEKLPNDVIAEIEVEYYDSQIKNIQKIIFNKLVENAKKQVKDYATIISQLHQFKDKEIIKFVVIRCGPSKLIGYKVEGL